MNSLRLFATLLGGKAEGALIEQHDVVFSVAADFTDTYPDLREQWFGCQTGLHADGYVVLDQIAGYRIELSTTPSSAPERLYFVNLGGYQAGHLLEQHINTFVAASDANQAKQRAKQQFQGQLEHLHKDALLEVDHCKSLEKVQNYFVHVHVDPTAQNNDPKLGYFLL